LHLTVTDAATHLVVPNVPVTFTDTASWNTGNITKGDGTAIADGAVACTTDAAGTCDVTLKTLKVRSTTATSGDNIAYDVKLVAGTNPAPVTVPSLFLAGAPDPTKSTVTRTGDYLMAGSTTQQVTVEAVLNDVNDNPVPLEWAQPELTPPANLKVTVSAKTSPAVTNNRRSWTVTAENLKGPWLTAKNATYNVTSGAGAVPTAYTFSAVTIPVFAPLKFVLEQTGDGVSDVKGHLLYVNPPGSGETDSPNVQFEFQTRSISSPALGAVFESVNSTNTFGKGATYEAHPTQESEVVSTTTQAASMRVRANPGGLDPSVLPLFPLSDVRAEIPSIYYFVGPFLLKSKSTGRLLFANVQSSAAVNSNFADQACRQAVKAFNAKSPRWFSADPQGRTVKLSWAEGGSAGSAYLNGVTKSIGLQLDTDVYLSSENPTSGTGIEGDVVAYVKNMDPQAASGWADEFVKGPVTPWLNFPDPGGRFPTDLNLSTGWVQGSPGGVSVFSNHKGTSVYTTTFQESSWNWNWSGAVCKMVIN
ncbi:TPA: hypothetical protein H2U99_004629, partial [Salmonella enterica]|nr:hypothetical protein [Salmonella enterica]